jgi:GlcNAc-P-P-Und epimerase
MRLLVTGGSGFIGTHTVTRLLDAGHEVVNVSLEAPKRVAHAAYWRAGDVLDPVRLVEIFASVCPEVVVHLAARTEMDEGTTPEVGFAANTQGTRNLLAAVRGSSSVRRLVVCSSQFVCGPGRLPRADDDYFPATVYGQSKVIAEQATRTAALHCAWTIVRPTNIWGPFHPRYPNEFWKIARRGLYAHPGREPVVRSYGYVGNVVEQLLTIVERPTEDLHQKVLYLGDPPDDIRHWADAFCVALSGRRAPTVPRSVLRAAGRVGDAIGRLSGRPFYLTSSRFQSMITDYPTPMERTYELLGRPRFTLDEGVAETVAWLRTQAGFERIPGACR